MSQQYDNTDRGVLFKNDRKESDNHPDYKGQINVGGVEFWLSAWIKEGQKGKFMSLSVKPKDDAAKKPAQKTNGQMRQEARGGRGGFDRDDDIPPF